MLNAMRKGAAGWVAKVLFTLLIASFALWGITGYLGGRSSEPVATVGDSEITEQDVRTRFENSFERLRRQFGGQIDRSTAIRLGLPQQALGELVAERLFANEAQSLGIAVSDDTVRNAIRDEKAFQTATGAFDPVRYRQVLANAGMSEGAYVANLKRNIARQQIATALKNGATAPASLARMLDRFERETRRVTYFMVPVDTDAAIPEPTDEELATFHDKHKSAYTAPELRKVTLVSISPDDIAATIEPSEEAIKQMYESRAAAYRTPERRTVAQLLFQDQAAAKAAADRLRGGADFEDVRKEATDAGAAYSDLGTVARGDLFPASVADAAFAGEDTGVAGPVQSPLGWHVLEISDIEAGATRPLDEVRDEIRTEVAKERAIDDAIGIANKVEDAVATGATLSEAAKGVGLNARTIEAVDRSGQDAAGEPVEGLPASPRFLDGVFTASEGGVSPLVDTGNGGYFIFRVDGVTAPALRPLDTIREQVVADWKARKRVEAAESKAEEVAESIRSGIPVAEAAAAYEIRSPSPFTREGTDDVPKQVSQAAFANAANDVAVVSGENGSFIVRVDAIDTPRDASDEQLTTVSTRTSGEIESEIEAQFAAALHNRYDIDVNQAAFGKIF